MKRLTSAFVLVLLLAAVTVRCAPGPPPSPVLAIPTATGTQRSPTHTPIPQVHTIVVDDLADSGPGTLRQALLDAQSGDAITFDPSVFPPDAPATIGLSSSRPELSQANLMIERENGKPVIRDLLVKDYPIILRLIP